MPLCQEQAGADTSADKKVDVHKIPTKVRPSCCIDSLKAFVQVLDGFVYARRLRLITWTSTRRLGSV